eukprot:2640315-Rhodomonas_salina.2
MVPSCPRYPTLPAYATAMKCPILPLNDDAIVVTCGLRTARYCPTTFGVTDLASKRVPVAFPIVPLLSLLMSLANLRILARHVLETSQ